MIKKFNARNMSRLMDETFIESKKNNEEKAKMWISIRFPEVETMIRDAAKSYLKKIDINDNLETMMPKYTFEEKCVIRSYLAKHLKRLGFKVFRIYNPKQQTFRVFEISWRK